MNPLDVFTTKRAEGHRGRVHACNDACNALIAWTDLHNNHDPSITMQDIADHFGLSRSRIQQVITSHGLTWNKNRGTYCTTCKTRFHGDYQAHRRQRSHRNKIQAHRAQLGDRFTKWDELAFAYALYEAGYRQADIRQLTGRAHMGLYRYLRRNHLLRNLKPGHYDRWQYAHFRAIANRNAEVIALRDSGSSTTEVAQLLNIPTTTVWRIMTEHSGRKRE